MLKNKAIAKQLHYLLELQAVDCEWDSIFEDKGTLPQEVNEIKDDLVALAKDAQNIKKECTKLEQEIVAQRVSIKEKEAQIKKYQAQQMDVRNNREYDAISKELDLKKLEIQLAEKYIKDAYERRDKQKIDLEQIQTLEAKKQQALTDRQSVLETLNKEKEEENLQKQRSKIKQHIDDSLLEFYEQLRSKIHNKLAVVTVKKGACSGCFIILPLQRQIDIKKQDNIIKCEHCGRIIADVTDSLKSA